MATVARESKQRNFARAVVAFLVGVCVLTVVMCSRSTGVAPMTQPATGDSSGGPSLRLEILNRDLIRKDPGVSSGIPRCVLFDRGMTNGSATLAAFDDGTTSLYFGKGGGYLGMGGHETVRRAAAAFREEAARSIDKLKVTADFDLPGPGFMAFFIVTDTEVVGSGPIPAPVLQSGRHPLSRLGKIGNDVITEVRLVADKMKAGKK